MSMPELSVLHSIPGRTRLRAESKDPETLQRLRNAIGSLELVSSVATNPVSGTILVEHEKGLNQLRSSAKQAEVCEIKPLSRRTVRIPKERVSSRVGHWTSEALSRADEIIHVASHGAIDLRLLMFGALFGAGLWQWRHGKILPAGVTLLWAALDLARGPALE